MVKIKDPKLKTIEQVVCANTGMSADKLMNDQGEYKIQNLSAAAEMLKEAIHEKKRIYIAGDYDVDGVMATGILYLVLKKLGAMVAARLPKRFSEGYGLSVKMIDEFQDGQMVITVDNGITALEAIKKAKAKNMTVIVTDHHLGITDPDTNAPIYPEADLIIDPKAVPRSADFDEYCGAGLAYRLAIELIGNEDVLIPKLNSMAAIATVADSVPLVYENRRIVKMGLEYMTTKNGTTLGLNALLNAFGLTENISGENIGYKIAPALNAPGRLRDNGAMDALRLVVSDQNPEQARKMADELIQDNNKRRSLSEEWSNEVIRIIEEKNMTKDVPIALYVPKMPEGIIGIIAGRISEKYHTPCFILGDTPDPNIIKGSGRSYGNVHLKKLLDANASLLTKYGGHAPAAGMSLELSKFQEFRHALINTLKNTTITVEEQTCDIVIEPNEINKTMQDVIKFQPYGVGNPAPVVLLKNLELIPDGAYNYKLISSGRGVKLSAAGIEVVSFNGGEAYEKLGNPKCVDVLGTMSQNHFMGKVKNQMEMIRAFPCKSGVKKTALALALERRSHQRYGK